MNVQAFSWHSIKTKVVFATLGIFVVGIWSLAFYVSHFLHADMQRLLGEQQFSLVSLVAHQVNHELEDRVRLLEDVARLSEAALQSGPAAVQQQLDRWKDVYERFNGGVFVTGQDGIALAAIPHSTGRVGVNYRDRDYLKPVLHDGKTSISEPLIGRTSKVPVVVIAVPLRNELGQIIGALAGVVNMVEDSFLDRITRSHFGRGDHYLLVTPKERRIATATDKQRVMEQLPPIGDSSLLDRFMRGFEGTDIATNRRGEEVLASAKIVPIAGWYVIAQLPTEKAFAPIREMQVRMFLASLVLTLLAGYLAWALLRRQLAPLFDAAQMLARMSETTLPPHPLPIVRQDEIGQLIGGFNRLLVTLTQRESLLTHILDTSSVGIFLLDLNGRITQANRRMHEMFARRDKSLIGGEYIELLQPGERDSCRQQIRELFDGVIAEINLDRHYRREDQSQFWGHLAGRCLLDTDNIKRGMVGVIIDINERKQAEARLSLAASVFSHAREGITITSADGKIIDVNESFTRITGYSREEAQGQNPRMLKSRHHDAEFYAAMWRDLLANDYWHGEIWNRRKSGELYPELLTISAVRDASQALQHYVALFTDITPMKEQEEKLRNMAHFDMLTLLPNRVLLADRLYQAMAQAMRRGQRLAVVCLDLDGFKAVNDTYGHKAGDQLLVALAARMKQALREGDTLARLGGDEFVAVLSDMDSDASCLSVLNRLLTAASLPVTVETVEVQVSASLGVTFYPQEEEANADQLMRQADQAMYEAKLSGKNRYRIFDDEQHRSVRGTHENIEDIRRSLNTEDFVLYYQPKVNMRSGLVFGVEALLRWRHAERGLLSPALFLPDIADHPLSIELGEWVIETALKQLEQWRREGLALSVSVNVGARQLQHPSFIPHLQKALQAYPMLDPEDLEIEVLETSALQDLDGVAQLITDCRKLGVSFSLDDFGTGYSSLAYLKRLPVHQIKIDQDFVRDMLADPDDLTILDGIITLGKAFHRQVIAEGVETIEHGTILLQLGCERAQGYGIARPMPGEDFSDWVAHWQPDPLWSQIKPVSHDNLPLLFSLVEHRAWILKLEKHLRGAGEAPVHNLHKCRFNQWLHRDGRSQQQTMLTEFQVVENLHQQLHLLADELCLLYRLNQLPQLTTRLSELHHLRDTLLSRMQGLIQALG